MPNTKLRVADVGGGWYGFHITKTLSERSDIEITLFEKKNSLANGTSGNLGVRAHLGLHYDRSALTRENCRRGFAKFDATYSQLLSQHGRSLYAIGDRDIDDKPSKITAEDFNRLAPEHSTFDIKELSEFKEYQHLETIIDTGEKSIKVGSELREAMNGYLKKENIQIKLNSEIETIVTNADGKILITTKDGVSEEFDAVINTTSYQQFLPDRPLLFNMKVIYQSCLGLLYEDTQEKNKGPANPIIIMDGWFPCLVYYDNKGQNGRSRFLLTHAKFTNLNSCNTPEEARTLLFGELKNPGFLSEVEKSARGHMTRFYPEFSERFEYKGYVATVHAKTSSESDYRGTLVFQDEKSKIIHVFPGKITDIFDAADDVSKLLMPELSPSPLLSKEGYRYVANGTLFRAETEISKPPTDPSRSTYSLQTGKEIWRKIGGNPSFFENQEKRIKTSLSDSCPSLSENPGDGLVSVKPMWTPPNCAFLKPISSDPVAARNLSESLTEFKQRSHGR